MQSIEKEKTLTMKENKGKLKDIELFSKNQRFWASPWHLPRTPPKSGGVRGRCQGG